MALAAVAAGADGLEIEVHDTRSAPGARCPESEGFSGKACRDHFTNCRKVAAAIGREM